MQKHITADEAALMRGPSVRVVIVTLDSHLASAAESARVKLLKEIPGLRFSMHAAADWEHDPNALERCRDDISKGDIIIANMLFMEDHIQAVLPALQARRDYCDAMIGAMSAGEVMRLTRLGAFKMDGTPGGAMALLKRLRGSPKKVENGSSGASQMAMLKRIPKLLRFIPGTAQDVRAYFLTLQYWLAGSEENVVNLVRFLVDRYADGDRRSLRGTLSAKAPREYPEIGVYHPRMPGRVSSRIEDLPAPAIASGGTVGLLILRSYVLADNGAHYDGVIKALEARGLRVVPAFATGLDNRPAIDAYFKKDGRRAVDAVVSLTGFSLVGGPAYNDARAAEETLADLDVPYVAAHPVEFQSLEQWAASARGLMPIESTIMVAIPELDGSTGPMIFGGRTDGSGNACTGCSRGCVFPAAVNDRNMHVCAERAEMLAARVSKLIRLRRSERADRKIGVVLFNFPPNAGATGTAAFLSVFQSLHNTLKSLRDEGYTVEFPETVDALRESIIKGNAERFGANANVMARISTDDHVSRQRCSGKSKRNGGPRPVASKATAPRSSCSASASVILLSASSPRLDTRAIRCGCCSKRASRRRTPSARSTAILPKTLAFMLCCISARMAR